MLHKNFTSLKFLIAFSMIVFMLGPFGATPVTSTTTILSTNFVMNSNSFKWVNLTNDSHPNSFSYSYNISSTSTENLTLRIELYNNNTQVTYLYDVVNKTIPVSNNTVFDTVNYNFTQSGLFSAKIYWFSQTNQILYYKEISSTEVVGLNGSVYNLGYKMWYNWQLVNYQSSKTALNFTVNFYFSNNYNVTFDYELNFHNFYAQTDNLFTGSKQMIGTNNTYQNINWLIPLNSGSYNVSLVWKDFLIYPLANVNNSFTFNVNVPSYKSPVGDSGHFYHQGYYQEIHVSPFPVILAFLFPIGVLIFVGFVVYKSSKKPPRHHISNQRNLSNSYQTQPNPRVRPLVASFCSNCGSKVIDSNDYCPNCGTKLDWD